MSIEDKIIQRDAKSIVDLLYDTKVFKSDLTRDNLNAIEEFVAVTLETRLNSYVKQYKLKEMISNQNS